MAAPLSDIWCKKVQESFKEAVPLNKPTTFELVKEGRLRIEYTIFEKAY
jgi:hypothetical protein